MYSWPGDVSRKKKCVRRISSRTEDAVKKESTPGFKQQKRSLCFGERHGNFGVFQAHISSFLINNRLSISWNTGNVLSEVFRIDVFQKKRNDFRIEVAAGLAPDVFLDLIV